MSGFFRDLDPKIFQGTTVLLDLDGTIVPDGAVVLANGEDETLRRIVAVAGRVIVVSNNLRNRDVVLKEHYRLHVALGSAKKPSKNAVGEFVFEEPTVVVGDKYITDGMFAHNLRARFIHVRRLENDSESFFVRMSYALDSLFKFFFVAVPYIELARPRQWVKNVLLFVPLIFAGQLLVPTEFLSTFLAFFSFSLVASAGYAINDIRDRAGDSLHPKKKHRPIASGRISVTEASWFAGALFAGALVFAATVPATVIWVLAYAALSLVYSFFLKKVPVLEMFCIGVFFLLRIEAGSAATGLPISDWLVLITVLGALFVAACKRYGESLHPSQSRSVLKAYPPALIRVLPGVFAVLLIVAYALYSFFGAFFEGAVLSNLFVAFGVLWYVRSVYLGETEEPDVRFWRDPILFFTVLFWGLYVIYAYYGEFLNMLFSRLWQLIS